MGDHLAWYPHWLTNGSWLWSAASYGTYGSQEQLERALESADMRVARQPQLDRNLWSMVMFEDLSNKEYRDFTKNDGGFHKP